ncbi:MAG TPA: chorismate synthase [Bacteroidales bacterium]|nr:chorismate synthase [Bacteroidales bacterium]HSA44095.1 chorismate synthase [Bacteroidales bacterium]
MAGNTTGKIFRLTSFGESHGPVIGGVVDGCPPGLPLDTALIQQELDRRRPGLSRLASSRQEEDKVELLSGVFEGMTLGSPIAFIIRNTDSRPGDYEQLRDVYRPSHADYTYQVKYGIRDHRGGGRSSARETAVRVAGGSIARVLLNVQHIEVIACTSGIGKLSVDPRNLILRREEIESNALRCPDPFVAAEMEAYLDTIRKEGDSTGSEVFCLIRNLPAGLGEPVFDKFGADLAKAMLSINACNGFDIGSGFRGISMKGSEHNDPFIPTVEGGSGRQDSNISTSSNHAGGVLGGITSGQDVYFRCSFKPVPSISKEQQTSDRLGKPVTLKISGRHDSCIAPRAVAVVEAMACLVTADHLLRQRTIR